MTWHYSVKGQDLFNGTATRSYDLVAADYAAARVIGDQILVAFQGWSDLAFTRGQLSEVDELAGVAGPSSNIDRGATVQFDLGAGKRASLNFPSPLVSTINTDRSVDLADALVLAWTGIFTGGSATLSDGELAQDVVKGTLDK